MLQTNERLQARGISFTRDSELCEGHTETHIHLFLKCKVTKPALICILEAWRKTTKGMAQRLGYQTIINMDLTESLLDTQKTILLTAISMFKQAVWAARKKTMKGKKQIGDQWILKSAAARVKRRRPELKERKGKDDV